MRKTVRYFRRENTPLPRNMGQLRFIVKQGKGQLAMEVQLITMELSIGKKLENDEQHLKCFLYPKTYRYVDICMWNKGLFKHPCCTTIKIPLINVNNLT